MEGVILRYGFFYGPNTWYDREGIVADQVRRRQFPIIGHGQGVWPFVHVEDAAALATVAALTAEGRYLPCRRQRPLPDQGGVGSFAIQLAAWKGSFVSTTVSEGNMQFARELGAAEVIDYQKTKFEEIVKDADLILDLVGGDTLKRSFAAVKEGGRVVTIASSSESTEEPKFKAAFFIVEANQEQLDQLTKLIDTGILRPVVSEALPLEGAAEAYFLTKKTRPGKIALRVLAE